MKYKDDESKSFTPGPWFYSGEPETESYERYVFEDVTGWEHPVAHIRFNSPNSEANAKLIAAAPELLKACQEMDSALECCCGSEDWRNKVMGPARTALQQAIRKAQL